MGCASSTPMIQTTGSEMLKAATHVATDATKTAEDAVEGIKDSVGKTVETAKETVAATLDSVKHDVENVVKEKSEMLDDATHSLMEKLHLKQTENESESEHNENVLKTETEELKTQLNENLKHTTADDKAEELAGNKVEQTSEAAKNDIREVGAAGTDTETDSLKTSTPEPEIELAFAKGQNSQEDGNDNPPTPKPTLAELENLTAELFKEQHQKQQQLEDGAIAMLNDMPTTMNNDPVISVKHEHIKTSDGSNNMLSLTADSHTIEDNEPTNIATTAATTTTTTTVLALANNDSNTTNVHHTSTPKNPTAVNTKHFQVNTLAASAATAHEAKVVKEQEKQKKSKKHMKEQQVQEQTEEKRPRTTEWEKFADMLAQIRKFNPHDAFRRGGTYTKFGGAGGGGGIGHFRERSFGLGRHARSGLEDDHSESTSNFRGSPQHSQRSSARPLKRVEQLPNRPNTGNNRRNAGGPSTHKTRRSSNVSSTVGRRFDYNPTRSRVNEFVSSIPFVESPLLQTTADAQTPYALYSTSYAGVTTPPSMTSPHSRSAMIALPPLEMQERARSRSQPPQNHQHSDNFPSAGVYNGNSMPLANHIYTNDVPIFIRQCSNISLSTNSSEGNNVTSYQSTNVGGKLQTSKLPNIKNTSSFLATPRSPFSLRKSYTDLYFSTTFNKENKSKVVADKSPCRKRKSINSGFLKHSLK